VFGGSPTTGRASDSRLATVEAQSARAGLQAIGRAAEYRSSRPAENGRVDLFRADGCGTRSIGYSNTQPQDGKITVAYRSAQSGRFSRRIWLRSNSDNRLEGCILPHESALLVQSKHLQQVTVIREFDYGIRVMATC